MPKILALDTSTEACSVALKQDDECLERFEIMPRLHARKLLPMIEELMAEAELDYPQLDAIAFGRGPGSFTGLRIAASVAQGLAFAAQLPVVPVSTLAALAQGAASRYQAEGFLTLLDARMGEIYWAAYVRSAGLVELLGRECLSAPHELADGLAFGDRSWVGVGQGWQLGDVLPQDTFAKMSRIEADCYPHAADVAVLAYADYLSGNSVNAEQALPLYLRDKTAWRNIQQQKQSES